MISTFNGVNYVKKYLNSVLASRCCFRIDQLASFCSFCRGRGASRGYPRRGGCGMYLPAVYLSRGGITPIVVTGPTVGGAITQSHSVQNWPGELEISGVELSDRIKNQAVENGAVLLSETVVDVDFSKRPFLITVKEHTGSGDRLKRSRLKRVLSLWAPRLNFLASPVKINIGLKGSIAAQFAMGALQG